MRRTGRALGICQHLAEALVGRAQFAEQLRAERSQAYPPAGPFEQPAPDPAFQRLYRLADPGGRQVQPRRGSPEVQLVGHGEEGLDLPGLDHRYRAHFPLSVKYANRVVPLLVVDAELGPRGQFRPVTDTGR